MIEGVREAACAVRPYLTDFMNRKAAAELDAELAQLLNSTGDVAERLRAVLDAHDDTRFFLERVLDDAPRFRPPQVIPPKMRGYGGLPGQGGPVDSEKFRCPNGDYTWYRPEVGVDVGSCPTHPECRLQPA